MGTLARTILTRFLRLHESFKFQFKPFKPSNFFKFVAQEGKPTGLAAY
jgi:hypothetical protein